MKWLILSVLIILNVLSTHASSITISFVAPEANSASDSILLIRANITSTFSLSSIQANVEGRVTNLVWDDLNLNFLGTINLVGLQQAVPLLLSVVATDAFGTQQTATQTFYYVPPPKINVVSPRYSFNAYPTVHIKANCISADPNCQIRAYLHRGTYIFDLNFGYNVDTIISIQLSGQQGEASFYIQAHDSWNQFDSKSVYPYVDSSIYLSPVYTATAPILDFKDNKILFGNGTGRILDLQTHNQTEIPGSNFDYVTAGSLTPFGAIYYQNDNNFNDTYNGLYDWNDNTLNQLTANNVSGVHTAGQWATWWGQGGLHRRNLLTKTNDWTETLLFNERPWFNDVWSDGTVVYCGDEVINQFKNNQVTAISSISGGTSLYPIIDSNHVIYLKKYWDFSYAIYEHDGTSEILLNDMGELTWTVGSGFLETMTPSFYQANNKYVAYIKPDIGNVDQVWLKDSAGNASQRTFIGGGIELLNSKGDIAYYSGEGRYIAKRGPFQLPVSYGWPMGKLYYNTSDSSWYLVEGINLYRLLIDAYISVGNGHWNDPATWTNGIVPPPNADVIILTNVTVNVNVTCNAINIRVPGSINVLPGITLTVLH